MNLGLAEASIIQELFELFGRESNHTFHYVGPFGVGVNYLNDDGEDAAGFENAFDLLQTSGQVRPEIDSFDGCDEVKLLVLVGQFGCRPLLDEYLFAEEIGVEFACFSYALFGDVEAINLCRITSFEESLDCGTSSASDVEHRPTVFEGDETESPVGEGCVTFVHKVEHKSAHTPFRTSAIGEKSF